MQGTPGGAAAKEVARLSMHKLRDLQQQLAAAEERASGADRKSGNLTASLAAAQDKLAVAQHEAEARAAEAAKLTADMQRQAGDMLALQAKVQQEEEGRKAASSQVSVSDCCAATARVCCVQSAVTHTPGVQFSARCGFGFDALLDTTSCFPRLLTAALQALEAALADARSEASALSQLRDGLVAAAERDAMARLTPLQAGGRLALVAVVLPFLQFLYFSVRLAIWLAAFMQRLGFH